ncbi:hypothetical protein H8E77_15735 [bacterium]|nr:hypothetical protein [bacterium]
MEDALAGIRTVLKNEPQTVQYLDDSAFVVKMKQALVEPANSNSPSIDGGSIGLPVAIAIYSLVTQRRLRPNITATGTVKCDGTIGGVSAIPGKIKKLSVGVMIFFSGILALKKCQNFNQPFCVAGADYLADESF